MFLGPLYARYLTPRNRSSSDMEQKCYLKIGHIVYPLTLASNINSMQDVSSAESNERHIPSLYSFSLELMNSLRNISGDKLIEFEIRFVWFVL